MKSPRNADRQKKTSPQPTAPAPRRVERRPKPQKQESTAKVRQAKSGTPQVAKPRAASQPPVQLFRRVIHQKIQPVSHQVKDSPAPKVDPIAKVLLSAHELSQHAATEDDYTSIIEQCRAALSMGAQGDKKQFARQLSSWSLNRRGQLRVETREPLAANADFQAAIDFNNRNWRALHNRGVSRAQAGEYAKAFDDFNRVLKLNPRYAKAYTNRALLYVQANDLHSAADDYELASKLDPNLIVAHTGRGRVCHMLGRFEQA
ncbi:MAG: tetratricopeptide repeat protein, partial [Pirellulales bacterium]|nr:tetratricopeptide repeat protein [Pirellulales bacterium]